MKTDRLTKLGPFHLAAGAMVFSLLISLMVMAATWLLTRAGSAPQTEGSSTETPSVVQPELETPISTEPPSHFTEEIIVPGFTQTGAQIAEEDATRGSSPEGV